ncbi:hypothetical protein GCM10028801_41350 [Nocardioides maradonensis]
MPFDPPVIDTDEDAVAARILDGLVDRLDGWQAYEGAPEVALAEELGREIAVMNQTTIDILDLAVAAMGETAFGFPAFPGVPASITATITTNAAGTIIPAGFTATGVNPSGAEVAFELSEDVGVAGTSATVTLVASEVGDYTNGVPVGPLTVVTVTTNVDAVSATTASTNGADAELVEDYLDRLTDYLSTLRPGGVTGADLEALARSVPGVHRALGVDLYDPANPTVETERTVTVFPIDETGHYVSAPLQAQVQAMLEAAREVNFIVHVASPTYQPINLVYDVVAEAGADHAAVLADTEAALADWLTSWGRTSDDEQAWVETLTVRIFDAVRILGSVAGVAYVDTITINGTAADHLMTGPAALPTPLDAATSPSTISGTVS